MDFFHPAQTQIIELLLTGDKTLSELSSALRRSKPGTSKHLKRLEQLGIVTGSYERNVEGRTIRYHLEPYHLVLSIDPLSTTAFCFSADGALDTQFPFLGFIVQKEFRAEVKKYLEELRKTDIPRFAVILYGSVASGTATRKSDIDLLVIKEKWMKNEQEMILRVLAETSEKTVHTVKPLFLSRVKFEQMDPAFKKEINDHGILLLEQGSPWEVIRKDLRRYKTITC